jgi:predicted transcriptional regulator
MSEATGDKGAHSELLRMAANVVAAYVGNNALPAGQIPEIISSVYHSLRRIRHDDGDARGESLRPAVPIKKSVTADYIVCLEDGKKLKMLKRHLRTTFNMTPEQYRAKWGLPADYPMVAANYAEQRSAFAKKIGLGRKPVDGSSRRGRRAKSGR